MAGEAVTQDFMLATATVMIGEQTALYGLNPMAHSIGLVKNFKITAAPTYTELTQGVKNDLVYSIMTQNKVTATMEVYEYTSRNLAYGLGLDGTTVASITDSYLLNAPMAGADTTVVIQVSTDNHLEFPDSSWVVIQDAVQTDYVHVVKTSGASVYAAGPPKTLTLTLDHPSGAARATAAGSTLTLVNRSNIGDKDDQPFLSAKVVGIMPNDDQPLILLFPKLRITKGFELSFQTTAFASMPFEFTPYDLISTDYAYADFVGDGQAFVFSAN